MSLYAPNLLKRLYAPHLGKLIAFGRKKPRVPGLRLRLSSYLDHAALPPAPATTNFRASADKVLRQIYGNDELGDCVPAGFAHVLGEITGNAGDLYAETLKQVVADYGAIGGYVPGQPETDQGCDEETALNYYLHHGFANGSKLLGWLAVDPTNEAEVRQAMFLFENLVFGIGLPDAWISPFPEKDGFTWGVAGDADDNNGHCVVGIDLATNGVVIDTWALEGVITHQAIAKYCVFQPAGGQLFVCFSPDQLAKGMAKAPNGVAWADLISDFNALGGRLPVPPAPLPVPVPVPPVAPPVASGPTRKQVRAALAEALRKRHAAMTGAQAVKIVDAALATVWP